VSEQLLKQILSEIQNVNQRLDRIETDVTTLKTDVSEIKPDISSLEGQMIETNQIVKAIRHNTEFISAEVNGLKITTANLEAVTRTEKMITMMNAKVSTKDDVAELRTHIIDEIDAVRTELKENITQVETNVRDDMKSLFEIAGEHEVKIRTLTRRPV
jgi:septal ring factor EnvC (AmiA/AmiB activator)